MKGQRMRRGTLLLRVVIFALALSLALAGVAFAQNGSNFGNTCNVADHTAQDPIYEPDNTVGHGHDHITYGKLGMMNSDTTDSLRGKPSSCNRFKTNSSLYWHPEVYQNDSNTPLAVNTDKGLGDNTIYYRLGDIENRGSLTNFPVGLEMVARDDGGPGDVEWRCDAQGTRLSDEMPNRCDNQKLLMSIDFPQCYVSDSSNASQTPDVMENTRNGNCNLDSGNFRPIPKITFSVTFDLRTPAINRLRVSGGHGEKLPYQFMHGDFVDGWMREDTVGVRNGEGLNTLYRECISQVPETASTGDKPGFCQDPNR